MNWDWEKLQEKRQRQTNSPPPTGGGENNPFGNIRFKGMFPGGIFNRLPLLPLVGICALLWLASGIFIVNIGEEGVVLRFGKHVRTVQEGPNYRLPWPVESHITLEVAKLKTVELGLPEAKVLEMYAAEQATEKLSGVRPAAKLTSPVKPSELSMFTRDENIVHMQFRVQYRIRNSSKFLFNVKDPETVIRNTAEAVMREEIGKSTLEQSLARDRTSIQSNVQAQLVTILEDYDIGVQIEEVHLGDVYPPVEVKSAFFEVASALEAQVTIQNEAEAYRASIVPVAKGTAESEINQAMAYSEFVKKKVEGDAERFSLLSKAYAREKDAVRKRLYYDAMKEILASPDVKKVMISKNVKDGVLPILHMDDQTRAAHLSGSAGPAAKTPQSAESAAPPSGQPAPTPGGRP